MTNMIKLSNSCVELRVDPFGAELKSARLADAPDVEYIWQGDAASWNGSAPVLFPICGGLRDDKCIINGREYQIPKHGFAMHRLFRVVEQESNSVTLLLTPLPGDESIYPYDYEFRVSFALEENSVKISYSVQNLSKSEMYFSLGAHEGYYLPGGISGCKLKFAEKETARIYSVEGPLLDKGSKPFLKDENTILLRDDYFVPDALIFKELRSRKLLLTDRDGLRSVALDFTGFDYFLIWMKPGADYVCLEPWCGMPDDCDSDYDLRKREGILCALPGEEVTKTHIITFGAPRE